MTMKDINYIEIKNCIADQFHIRSETSGIDLSSTKDNWQIDTIFLAKFLGNLIGGNIDLDVTDFKVRRRKIDSVAFDELAIVPRGTDDNFYYLDLSPRVSILYEYKVTPMSNDIEGESYTAQIQCEFDYWWLSNSENYYPFFANLVVSEIPTNIQRYVYEGFNEFPTIAYGDQKYQNGTITAILLDADLQTSYNYRKEVEDFINNKQPKYLKNPQGDFWIVDTHTSKRKIFTEIGNDVSSITFDWTEISSDEIIED